MSAYHFFDQKNNSRIEVSSEDQLIQFLENIKEADLDHIMMWTSGLKAWSPLTQNGELMARFKNIITRNSTQKKTEDSLVTNVNKVVSLIPINVGNGQIQLRPQSRKHPRIRANVHVMLEAGHHKFRTAAVDISQGGVRFEVAVPAEFLNDKCQIFIIENEMSPPIPAQGRFIYQNGHAKALEFEKMPQDSLIRISHLTAKFNGMQAA